MNKNKIDKIGVLLIVMAVIVIGTGLIAGCDPEIKQPGMQGETTAPELTDEPGTNKGLVELFYVDGWDCGLASTTVVAAVLEDMGYEVTTTTMDVASMWIGLANGSGDAMTTAWLPHTHAGYLEQTKGYVVEAAVNYNDPAAIGLVVPTYVDINSIEEINDYSDEFNGKIIGIDIGAGIMISTENAIEEYGLKVELVAGDGSAMTAALADAISRGEWIIVTGWSPHWKFAKWDLKYLADPHGTYGKEEYIATYVRTGLREEMPEVYKLLSNFKWSAENIGSVMNMNAQPGADPQVSARTWINENQDLVQSWIP